MDRRITRAGCRRFGLCSEGRREMLSRSPFIEVVGAARDGREGLEWPGSSSPTW